ncbi:MAG: hypothetical protein HYU66_08955 [Armatimonadetes bacterium]|nr:hypothetical protein [Armatimonadota bacterium]
MLTVLTAVVLVILPRTFFTCAVEALFATIALRFIMRVGGGSQYPFAQTYRLLLPVVALVLAADTLLLLFAAVFGIDIWLMLLIRLIATAVIYQQGLELEFGEFALLTMLAGLLHYLTGL